MPINLRDRLTFLFNDGKGVSSEQLDGTVVRSISRTGQVTQQTETNTEEVFTLSPSDSNVPDLPDSAAEDRDYKARVPSSGDPLWVRDTHDYNDLTNKPDLPTKADDDTIDSETDDSDYTTTRGVFRAIARKLVNATTSIPGLVLLARNVDVDATETDLTRVTTVAAVKRLIDRIRPSNRQLPEPTAEATDSGKVATLNTTATAYELTSQPTIPGPATTAADGLMSSADKTKLDGVEAGATEDQTAAEIRDSLQTLTGNNRLASTAIKDLPTAPDVATIAADGLMSSEDKTKLDGVEASAKDDQTPAEIRDSLQTLTGDDRLAASAVKDLPTAPDVATTAADGLMSSEDKTKLDGIDAGAKDDQTAAEIRDSLQTLTGGDRLSATAVKDLPSAPDNATTSADGLMSSEDKTKLDGIEASAKDDQTAAEIRDSLQTLTGGDRLAASAVKDLPSAPDNATTDADGLMSSEDKTKLDGIEASAKDDQTATEIRDSLQTLTGDNRLAATAVKDLPVVPGVATTDNDGLMSSEDKTKLNGVEAEATADQTAAEIRDSLQTLTGDSRLASTAVKGIPVVPGVATTDADGLMSSADKTKLDGVEASAKDDQTPAEIRDSLQTLTGDNRLSATAVKDLPASMGEENVQADWDETDSNSDAYIQNKPGNATTSDDGLMSSEDKTKLDGVEASAKDDQTATEIRDSLQTLTGVNRLSATAIKDLPEGMGEENVQSNWDETDSNSDAYIQNKPGNATTSDDGLMSSEDKTKLDGIEASAKDDQTAAEIRDSLQTLTGANRLAATAIKDLPSAPDNATTTADGLMSSEDKTKLDGIEANAKDDQSAAEIKTLYESNANTNAFTDTEQSKLSNIEPDATADQTASEVKFLYESNNNTNVFTDTEKTKLAGIEIDATADQTATEIKTLYESNANTNAYTDDEKTKLTGIEASATADQTAPEIKSLYESNSNTNAFTDGEKTKLAGIETNATADQTASEIKTSLETLSGANRLDASAVKNLPGGSYDHSASERRLSLLEQKTSELDVRDHTSWIDATQVSNAALFAQVADLETVPETIVGFSWTLSQTISTADNYTIYLRLAVGTDVNYRQVARENAAGVAQPDLHGHWVTLLTQGGYNYYYLATTNYRIMARIYCP